MAHGVEQVWYGRIPGVPANLMSNKGQALLLWQAWGLIQIEGDVPGSSSEHSGGLGRRGQAPETNPRRSEQCMREAGRSPPPWHGTAQCPCGPGALPLLLVLLLSLLHFCPLLSSASWSPSASWTLHFSQGASLFSRSPDLCLQVFHVDSTWVVS